MKYQDILSEAVDMGLGRMIWAAKRTSFARGVVVAEITVPNVDFLVDPVLGYQNINFDFVRQPDPEKHSDVGTNYFGVAMEKLAYMKANSVDSGTVVIDAVRKGETHLRGGLYRPFGDLKVFTACAGWTEDKEEVVAHAGMEMVLQQLRKSLGLNV